MKTTAKIFKTSLVSLGFMSAGFVAFSAQAQTQQTETDTPAQTQPASKYKPRIYGGATPYQPKTNTASNLNIVDTVKDGSGDMASSKYVVSKPKWPVDFSDQYTEIIAGVPIIENPASCGKNPLELRITVTNVKDTEGNIVADLHDDVRENFLVWDKVVLRVRARATEDTTTFCMPLPRPGDYAVAIYHDKNSNREFDKGFLGIPKERFGMSTNPEFGMRSPTYDESVFTIGEESMDLHIILRKASDVL